MPWTNMNREIEYNYENAGKDELRTLSYSEAIREALIQAMTLDKNVFIMGQGINDKIGMFGATTDIYTIIYTNSLAKIGYLILRWQKRDLLEWL